MPGTVTEEIEIMDAGHGESPPPPAGGDDDGGSGGGGAAAVPRRAYFTAISLGLAAILMFFMALTSSYIVRKGLGGDWQPVRLPGILWLNTLVLLASSASIRSEEHTSELQSRLHLVCRLLLEKKKRKR